MRAVCFLCAHEAAQEQISYRRCACVYECKFMCGGIPVPGLIFLDTCFRRDGAEIIHQQDRSRSSFSESSFGCQIAHFRNNIIIVIRERDKTEVKYYFDLVYSDMLTVLICIQHVRQVAWTHTCSLPQYLFLSKSSIQEELWPYWKVRVCFKVIDINLNSSYATLQCLQIVIML